MDGLSYTWMTLASSVLSDTNCTLVRRPRKEETVAATRKVVAMSLSSAVPTARVQSPRIKPSSVSL